MFYRVRASLVGFGLLLLIGAVASVKLRLRGGGQTPQKSLRRTAETPGYLAREGLMNTASEHRLLPVNLTPLSSQGT